jgi:hypothetical protein
MGQAPRRRELRNDRHLSDEGASGKEPPRRYPETPGCKRLGTALIQPKYCPQQARTARPIADFGWRPEAAVDYELMFDSTTTTTFTWRLTDAVDLLIDFATLGEYGLEPVGRTPPSCEGRKRQRAAPTGRPRVIEEPAATYSPRGLPPKYHRRRVA